jgi:DnaK suppressor protein
MSDDDRLDLSALRAQLEADRVGLSERIARLEADASDDAWTQPKPDEADQGAAAVERERLRSLAAQARDALEQTEAALVRMDKGTYGKCTDCGGDIPVGRLEARPEAELCVTCQQRRR